MGTSQKEVEGVEKVNKNKEEKLPLICCAECPASTGVYCSVKLEWNDYSVHDQKKLRRCSPEKVRENRAKPIPKPVVVLNPREKGLLDRILRRGSKR